MKKIQILSLELKNFKGAKSKKINFAETTFLAGANESGKTTIADAFTWLLFGKDTSGRTDFNVKTLDENNNPINHLEHSVESVLLVNNEEVILKRLLKEEWVTKRGTATPVFKGNVTDFYWNQVPMKASEYLSKIESIIPEALFKMVTSPTHFFSQHWEKQRQQLFDMAGQITEQQIANGNPAFESLLAEIGTSKSIEEYQKQLKDSIKTSKNNLQSIPSRIDEVNNMKPAPEDFNAIESEKTALVSQVEDIDTQLTDLSAKLESEIKAQSQIKEEISIKESRIREISRERESKAQQLIKVDDSQVVAIENEIRNFEASAEGYSLELNRLSNTAPQLQEKITQKQASVDAKRQEFFTEKEKVFVMPESSTCCPTCAREFDPADLEVKRAQLEANFNQSKSDKIAQIQKDGVELAKNLEDLNKQLQQTNSRIEVCNKEASEIQGKIAEFKERLVTEKSKITQQKTLGQAIAELEVADTETPKLQEEIHQLKESLANRPHISNQELKDKKEELKREIANLELRLSKKLRIQEADQRISQLMSEQKQIANTISELEGKLFNIEQFTKAKTELVETRVNKLFGHVKFKMFEQQINGGEKPWCTALINGVPYSDANTASKINAGIDVINALNHYYQVSAPIFIDNRESVTKLIETKSQVINLIVNPQYKDVVKIDLELVESY